MPGLAPGEQRQAVKKHEDNASHIGHAETTRLKMTDFSGPSGKGDGTLLGESIKSTETSAAFTQGNTVVNGSKFTGNII